MACSVQDLMHQHWDHFGRNYYFLRKYLDHYRSWNYYLDFNTKKKEKGKSLITKYYPLNLSLMVVITFSTGMLRMASS